MFVNSHYIPSLEDVHFLAVNDTPLFIKREHPRLVSMMRGVTDAQCATYINAGVVLVRNSSIALEMIDEWSKSIRVIPQFMIHEFPREQGAVNCLISAKYSKWFHLIPAFDQINLDRFIKYDAYIQHITSGYPMYRMVRFPEFLKQLIAKHADRHKHHWKGVAFFNDLFDSNLLSYDENITLLTAIKQPFFQTVRHFFNVTFIETAYIF
ncbi:hypothetical protein RFI_00523 [Reticulomyxa filosa]|uniref:Uncharacterized protein n=1 Tax=Reticulomyxa filosa TaxID=46433 RepID=X6PES0_RETFI|nr:hypothetical protein RFI_00523 [Reticulomyxa filosa]|eukprot:ETO36539.1 hypothetical protein RFI_00523 [Reticulomyxa filosa]